MSAIIVQRINASEHCVIFYEPLADGIDVVRVLHAARDVDAQFGTDSTDP
jgi:plasmid stabilization system protein ParE